MWLFIHFSRPPVNKRKRKGFTILYSPLFISLSDIWSRTSVGRTACLERVLAVHLSGLRRQLWVEDFVAAWRRKVEGSNAGDSVRIKFSGVQSEAVGQAALPMSMDLDWCADTSWWWFWRNPLAISEDNWSCRTSPGTTSKAWILSPASPSAERSARLTFWRLATGIWRRHRNRFFSIMFHEEFWTTKRQSLNFLPSPPAAIDFFPNNACLIFVSTQQFNVFHPEALPLKKVFSTTHGAFLSITHTRAAVRARGSFQFRGFHDGKMFY